MNDLNDEIENDDQCEWASEACGCESRTELRKQIKEMDDKREDFIFQAGAQGTKPMMSKVQCPHCKQEIKIVIAGMALLPSNSDVVKFELTWIERPLDETKEVAGT